jgi:hypothetical protein
VSRGDKYGLVEACHVSFDGGSSSSPTLRKDGTRAYVTDNLGKLIAVETIDCSRAWELDVGSVINGSIAVSSDNGELYAATRDGIFQVIDEGDRGVVRWVSKMDAFELPPDMVAMDVTIAGIGANAVSMQLAAGYPPSMFLVEGVAQLDRATGELRYFAAGGEATLAVMNSGPDGAVYLGNSGFRSATTNCMAEYGYLPMGGSPVLGGITKFAPERLDLLARDAICAASDRAQNAQANRNVCPESAEADVVQIVELITQARWAGRQAIDAGDFTAEGWNSVEAELATTERALDQGSLENLVAASEALRRACDVFE